MMLLSFLPLSGVRIVKISKGVWFVAAAIVVIFLAVVYEQPRESLDSRTTTQTDLPNSKKPVSAIVSPSDTKVVIPKNFQFAALAAPLADVDNLDSWLAKFPQTDQVKLRRFSGLYFGIYNIKGPGQIKWMEEHGYPLPEDVLAAASSSTEQLKNAAAQGNDKAKMLLLDRLIDEYVGKRDAFVAAGRLRSEFNTSDGQDLSVEILTWERELGKVDSPFVFLLKTRNTELLENADVITSDASRISGILAAHELGETRSTTMLAECVSAGLCNSEDVEVATSVALSISKTNDLNKSRTNCPQAWTTQMPPN